ncbi:MAG: carboxypeptidase regulatory-like domain-containing protein [Terriglobales bacterium]
MPFWATPTTRSRLPNFSTGEKHFVQVANSYFGTGRLNQDQEEFMLFRRMLQFVCLSILVMFAVSAFAQSETATISGRITDQSGAVLPGADVVLQSADRGAAMTTTTNAAGMYVFSSVRPGIYHLTVKKENFQTVNEISLTANVQDHIEQNFSLKVGAGSESVTVRADEQHVETTTAAVGTTIDRNFVSNIPLNGRSYQTLIGLTPGIVMVPTSSSDQGQFSVNGQRSNTNYVTVDGISANIGVPVFQALGQGVSGSLPGTDIQGGFTNLASVDALQEFRIQTSTYAPEFGRSPGAQISLVTRGGQNQFHGGVYEYLRNDVTDAKDWFDKKKPPLRFNDFGATFGGPIWKNKTFFFFSYEGQRFLLPQAALAEVVPSQSVIDNAPNALAKALLNAFPKPNAEAVDTESAYFRQSYSNPNHLDSYSIRVDHNFNSKYSIFVRYNDSPSDSVSRSTSNFSAANQYVQNTKTLTIGANQTLTNRMMNEIRLNGSRQQGQSFFLYDGQGGGVEPDPTIFLPPGYATGGGRYFTYSVFSTKGAVIGTTSDGTIAQNQGRSINVVDSLSWLVGKHQLKFGFDYRWYSPIQPGNSLIVSSQFRNIAQVYSNIPFFVRNTQLAETALVTPNYGSYAQDTWAVTRRLTVTYGLRWDINPAPHTRGGKSLVTLAAPLDLTSFDQSGIQLAPIGTPYYQTNYKEFAPRFGAAYQLWQTPGRETVLRAGWGMFYDLASTPFEGGDWPYSFTGTHLNIPVPVTPDAIPFADPNFTPSPSNRASSVAVAGRNFTAPRTYQWNVTLEQALGRSQSVSF